MKDAAIIGASRGIGLGLARELARRGWRVVATERTRSDALHRLEEGGNGSVEIATCDLSNRADPTALADRIGAGALDVVLVNGGVMGPGADPLGDLSRDDTALVMHTNAVGAAQAGEALLPCLREGGTLAFTSSSLGSIAQAGGAYPLYSASKAALNMLARGVFERDAKPRDIRVLSIHPGWVRTDMGGDGASISVEESAGGMADVLEDDHPLAHRFLDWRGRELPW